MSNLNTKLVAIPCNCGHPACQRYGFNIGSFSMGEGFDKEDAQHIVRLWNGALETKRDIDPSTALCPNCNSTISRFYPKIAHVIDSDGDYYSNHDDKPFWGSDTECDCGECDWGGTLGETK